MIEVVGVLPGSTGDRFGIRRGNRLVSVNGSRIRDSIDFQYMISRSRISLTVTDREGKARTLRIAKSPDDMLGIELSPLAIRRCRNRCIFCFVDQMPPGCRKSLYVRDDDYRASFLHGNYITLGNLADEDWERIFSQRLTPLYVSVHATEPDLRRSLLRNKNAPDILKNLERLASGGIRMHTQIVVCPGINDRDHLVRTIEDLARLFPSVASIAVVPVGITRFRSKLFPLRTFRPKEAGDVLTAVNAMGGRFKRLFGNRLVFPSDEFYIKSGEPFPPASFYEGFPQIENGVGMVSAFLRDARRTRLPARRRFVAATAVTGKSFGPVLKTVLKELYRRTGISIRVLPVGNSFFGPSVTVAGLLSGKDILRAIRGKRLGSMLLIPAAALKDGDAVFLDDVRLEDIERSAAVPVRLVASFSDMVKQLLSAATTRAPSRQ